MFAIKKYWHKIIVRAGKNTLLPYRNNPPDLIIQQEDILYFDFGPGFEDWDSDIGRTYVLGNDEKSIKLQKDVEKTWYEGAGFYLENKDQLTGSDFYKYTQKLAKQYECEYGNIHCGHLIGNLPHEKIVGEEIINNIHPEKYQLMCQKDKNGNVRNWIYEIHFINS